MLTIFLTWDIRQDKQEEYTQFVFKEYLPQVMALGIKPTNAWIKVVGEGPQVVGTALVESSELLSQILESPEWQRLRDRLCQYVGNFKVRYAVPSGIGHSH